MLLLHDRASMARALTLDLPPRLHDLLAERIASLATGEHDLTEWTEILVVQAGDTEADVIRQLGATSLEEPIDGARFPAPGFRPHWDWLANRGGWFEMIQTFGSTFAYVLLIEDADGVPPDLLALCRRYAVQKASG